MNESGSVHEEIARLVESGERDPLTIARKTISSRGRLWVGEQLLMMDEELLSDMARDELNRIRRQREIAVGPEDGAATVMLKQAKAWIPTKGYVQFDEVTVEDAELKSRWYLEAARHLAKRAIWWGEIHDLMVREGVETVGQLDVFPSLPDDVSDEVPEIAYLQPSRQLSA